LKILAIIPVRFASSRFPGKPLANIAGKTMVERVFNQVEQVRGIDDIVIATDNKFIAQLALSFGAKVIMTSTEIKNGTERCAAVVEQLNDAYDFVINIQGDEPFIQPQQIEELIAIFDSEHQLFTQAKKISDKKDIDNKNIVKVDIKNDIAIDFSRTANYNYKHIGLYAYTTATLLAIAKLPPSAKEIARNLEQWRWLEAHYTIKVGLTNYTSKAIDVYEDLFL